MQCAHDIDDPGKKKSVGNGMQCTGLPCRAGTLLAWTLASLLPIHQRDCQLPGMSYVSMQVDVKCVAAHLHSGEHSSQGVWHEGLSVHSHCRYPAKIFGLKLLGDHHSTMLCSG